MYFYLFRRREETSIKIRSMKNKILLQNHLNYRIYVKKNTKPRPKIKIIIRKI